MEFMCFPSPSQLLSIWPNILEQSATKIWNFCAIINLNFCLMRELNRTLKNEQATVNYYTQNVLLTVLCHFQFFGYYSWIHYAFIFMAYASQKNLACKIISSPCTYILLSSTCQTFFCTQQVNICIYDCSIFNTDILDENLEYQFHE